MTESQAASGSTIRRQGVALGASIPFDSIGDAGTYVCNWSGHLLRVPGNGLKSGRRPPLNLVGPEPLLVTKISHNPYVAVPEARHLARQLALQIDF
ncbi:MAG: hypothetical protein ABIG44_05750 [Planctomycetota bacterium]